MGSGVSVGRGLNVIGPYGFVDVSSKDDNTITTKKVSYQMQWAKVFKGVAIGIAAVAVVAVVVLVGKYVVGAVLQLAPALSLIAVIAYIMSFFKGDSENVTSNDTCNFNIV